MPFGTAGAWDRRTFGHHSPRTRTRQAAPGYRTKTRSHRTYCLCYAPAHHTCLPALMPSACSTKFAYALHTPFHTLQAAPAACTRTHRWRAAPTPHLPCCLPPFHTSPCHTTCRTPTLRCVAPTTAAGTHYARALTPLPCLPAARLR